MEQNRVPTTADWNEAMATKPLDMAEMDQLVRENQALWADREEKHKIAVDALKLAEASDTKLLSALRAAGKDKYHVKGVGTISLRQKPVVRVPGTIGAKEEFFSYLDKLGHDIFMSMVTVNSQTLNSWYGNKLTEHLDRVRADGGSPSFSVPGIEEPTMRESIAFLKEKKGKQ